MKNKYDIASKKQPEPTFQEVNEEQLTERMKEMSLYDFYQKTKNDKGGDNILMNAIIHNQMI